MTISQIMRTTNWIGTISLAALIACTTISCNEDPAVPTADLTPSSYRFERGGESSVSYDGQNERLDMVEQIKSKILLEADRGNVVSEQSLLDAFVNRDGNGGGLFSFRSARQLRDKVFGPDLDAEFFERIFERLAQASAEASEGARAANGRSGLITRENSGNTILVDENGREFTQLVEKGLMGSVFYNQIFNVYLSDSRTGDNVENDALVDGQNYTPLEHHWDEAFGYWNPPLDFTSPWPVDRNGETRFWSRYSNTVDNVQNGKLGTNSIIMEAFIKGRVAIVENDLQQKNESKEVLYEQLELVAAATAVHYINSTLRHLNDGKTGEALHSLTEAWAFVNAIKYSPYKRLTLTELEVIQEVNFGADGNFWNVTASGLNAAKSTLATHYAELEPVKDVL